MFPTIKDFEIHYGRKLSEGDIHFSSKRYGHLASFVWEEIDENTWKYFVNPNHMIYETYHPKILSFCLDDGNIVEIMFLTDNAGYCYIMQSDSSYPQFSIWFKVSVTNYLLAWRTFCLKLQKQIYPPPKLISYGFGLYVSNVQKYGTTIMGMDHDFENVYYFNGKVKFN